MTDKIINLKEITIDDVLKDYLYTIDSKHLSEDNIEIDTDLVVEDSSAKYTQLFAAFLNEAYYRGYAISDSILKKLMDIINYDGYEYQVMEKYVDIIFDHMNDYKVDEDNRPEFRKDVLDFEESVKYVTDYCTIISEKIYVNYQDIPHFKKTNSDKEDTEFNIHILLESSYPIHDIYEKIINDNSRNILSKDFLIKASYLMYKFCLDENYFREYYNLIDTIKSYFTIFFLLEEENLNSIDILVDRIKSMEDLRICIQELSNFNPNYITITVIKNIKRIITILNIDKPVDMIAYEIGKNYEFWKYISEKLPYIEILHKGILAYENDADLDPLSPLDNILEISKFDEDDRFFYTRYYLTNMDYRDFCNNFVKMFETLYSYLTIGECYDLISECIHGFIALGNASVNNEIVKLCDYLDKVTRYEYMDPILKYTCDTINSYIEPKE